MHIFLTGDIQVGKTTIIRRFLSQSGLSADGFMTYWEFESCDVQNLYLSSYSADSRPAERHLIAHDSGQQLVLPENMTSVFDAHGSDILANSGKRDVIVMDELGFLESKAAAFQQAVMRHISGNVPVLGVIKPRQTEFLDGIRAHPNVTVREVTAENRDAILVWLLEQGLNKKGK